MAKREIMRAAKKRGITILSAHYGWTPTPGEMVAHWEIQFGPELDDEVEYFQSSAEAVEYIESAEILGPLP